MKNKIILVASIIYSYSALADAKLPSFFRDNFDSIEAYIGLGIAYNKNAYQKSNNYNFNSTGSACNGNPCAPLLTDPLLVTSDSIDFSQSNSNGNFNIVPTFGIRFNVDKYNFSLESSYFINNFSKKTTVNNWKTLPNNPSGLGGNQGFNIAPMGQTINASLDENIGNIFTLSFLPGYQINDWLGGFLKIGWATTKFESNSKGGTNAGAGFLGISGNYSKRLHGMIFGFGLETEYSGFNFRLEYNRIQFSGFSKTSTELGSTANNSLRVSSSGPFGPVFTEGNINFQGNTKTKYDKFTNDIIMLSVVKSFSLLGDG